MSEMKLTRLDLSFPYLSGDGLIFFGFCCVWALGLLLWLKSKKQGSFSLPSLIGITTRSSAHHLAHTPSSMNPLVQSGSHSAAR